MENEFEKNFMKKTIEFNTGKFTTYSPLLKAKRGELKALSDLKTTTKFLTIPVIELVGGCKSNVIKYLKDDWGFENNKIFIDPFILLNENNGNFNEVKEILESVENHGVNTTLVIRLDYSDEYLNSIKNVLKLKKKIAVRVTSDFARPTYFNVAIERIKRVFNCDSIEIDLIVDYSYIDHDTISETISSATRLLRHLSKDEYSSITVVAGSFLKDLSDIIPDTVVKITRYEWELWESLTSIKELKELINYGDYATRYPIYEYGSQPYAGSSSIRYTTDDGFLILRGHRPDNHPDGMGQYHNKCNILINNPLYDGASFSVADAQINDCANKNISSGNPESWVRRSTARHIEKIVWLLL